MKINSPYQSRPIRFVERYHHKDWQVKIYSISIFDEYVSNKNIEEAKLKLDEWLGKSNDYGLATYKIATLILHVFKDGCYAIINWWTGENMLQNFVYLKEDEEYKIYSDRGITTCVWEMAVLWHERNAWVKHVLTKNENPDFEGYLNEQLNQDV
ncbi:MAG: hypothetical protein ACKVQV_13600 [Bacteroidia bacterium]